VQMQGLGASTQRAEAGGIDPARRVNGADAACRGVYSASCTISVERRNCGIADVER
jgi:hypothetical protein